MRGYRNRRQPFRVEGIYEGDSADFDINNKTLHARERGSRSDFIARMSKGSDVRLDRMFIVDKGHRNGLEVHAVYSNAVINIFNLNDKKYITSLIGRPGQIRRYYNDIGERPPREILDMAYDNYNRGYNRSDFNYSEAIQEESNTEPEFDISSDLLFNIYDDTQYDVCDDEQPKESEASLDDDLSR